MDYFMSGALATLSTGGLLSTASGRAEYFSDLMHDHIQLFYRGVFQGKKPAIKVTGFTLECGIQSLRLNHVRLQEGSRRLQMNKDNISLTTTIPYTITGMK
jgi:hypothetical protein